MEKSEIIKDGNIKAVIQRAAYRDKLGLKQRSN